MQTLLACFLCFLAAPLIDTNFFGSPEAPQSLRSAGQSWFSHFLEPRAAIFIVLLVCHRKRWFLKL